MRPGSALDSPPSLRMQLNPAPIRGSGLRQQGRRPSPPPLAGPSRPPQRPQMLQCPRTPPSLSGGPRRSERLRRVPTCPGNVYGEQRHPTDIERDTRHTQTWREMTDEQRRSQSTSSCSDHFQETNPGPSPPHSSNDPNQSLGECSEGSDDSNQSAESVDKVEETLSYLAKHGGVRNLNTLLATAVPPGSEIPDTHNIHKWSFKDIMRMPSAQQRDWIEACRQELDSLQERRVYDLVNPPQGWRVIKNRWVFNQKTDGRKCVRLVAKGISQVEGIDYDNVFSPVV